MIHDHHFSHLIVYMEKMNFCGALCSHPILTSNIEAQTVMRIFYKVILSNIMGYVKSDVEWDVGIQGMHLSAFGDYFWKRERSFKLWGGVKVFFSFFKSSLFNLNCGLQAYNCSAARPLCLQYISEKEAYLFEYPPLDGAMGVPTAWFQPHHMGQIIIIAGWV